MFFVFVRPYLFDPMLRGPTNQVSTNNENHVHVLISDMASILFLFG